LHSQLYGYPQYVWVEIVLGFALPKVRLVGIDADTIYSSASNWTNDECKSMLYAVKKVKAMEDE